MKNSMKSLLFIIFSVFTTLLLLTGCQNSSGVASGSKVKMKDIEWSVHEGIIEGERAAVFDVTNNSKYPLAGFAIRYNPKEGTTEDQINKFYSDSFQTLNITNETTISNIKDDNVLITAGCLRYVAPQKTESNNACFYFNTLFYLRDYSLFSIVEPDIALIKYIDGNKTHLIYYDFKTDQYSEDENKIEDANFWTETKLGEMIPKPDSPYIKNSLSHDSEDSFYFEAFDMTIETYEKYVNDCKNKGFTVDSYDGTTYYSAKNSDGYKLSVSYSSYSKSIDVKLNSPN